MRRVSRRRNWQQLGQVALTPEQRTLVQQTAEVMVVGGRFADRFYEHLFRLAPETRALFVSDMTALKLKFMNMLASIVGTLERPEMFASILTHLGRLHGRAGVSPLHYPFVEEALLATLSEILGPRFGPEVRAAWAALYADIAAQMQDGARWDRMASSG